MLLLTAVLVATVLFFLTMMVSVLVGAGRRTRRCSAPGEPGLARLSRLYLLEGLVMTAVATAAAPVLATGLVAAAGVPARLLQPRPNPACFP